MPVVKKCRELFAQGFIPLLLMASDYGRLENVVLYIRWKIAPASNDGLSEGHGKSLVHRHPPSLPA